MNVGDLVKYCADGVRGSSLLTPNEELGIITKTGTHRNGHAECHVVWFTCNNKGWWNSENLEVVSENR